MSDSESSSNRSYKKRPREEAQESRNNMNNNNLSEFRVRYTRVKDVGTRINNVDQRNKRIIEIAKLLPEGNRLSGRAVYWFVTREEVEVLFQDSKLFVWQERAQFTDNGINYILNQINFHCNKQGLIALRFPDGEVEAIECTSKNSLKSNKRLKLHADVSTDEHQFACYEYANINNTNQYQAEAIVTPTVDNLTNKATNDAAPSIGQQHTQHAPQILPNGYQVSANKPVVINILLLVPDTDEYIQMAERALLQIGFVKEVSSKNQQRLYSEKDLVRKWRHILLFPYGKIKYTKVEDCLSFASEVILLLQNNKETSTLTAATRIIDIEDTGGKYDRQLEVKTKTIPTTEISYQDLTDSAQQLFAIDELHNSVLGGINCGCKAKIADVATFLDQWNLGRVIRHVDQNIFICFKYEPTDIKAFTEYAMLTLNALGINYNYEEALVVNGSVLVYVQCPSYMPWYILQHAEEIFCKLKEEQLIEIYECFVSDIDASLEHLKNEEFIDDLTHLKELLISNGMADKELTKRITADKPEMLLQNKDVNEETLEDPNQKGKKTSYYEEAKKAFLTFFGKTFKKARDYFSIQLAPNNSSSHVLKLQGESKLLDGDYNGALADFDSATQLTPTDASIYRLRGNTKRMLGDYQGALEDFNRADEIQPNNVFTLQQRGATKRLLGDYTGALEDLNRADMIDPNDTFTLQHRAIVRYHLNEFKSALDDIEHVLKTDIDNEEVNEWKDKIELKIHQRPRRDEMQQSYTQYSKALALPVQAGIIQVPYSELKVIKTLGEGGFGEVSLAQWRGMNVALKKLKSSVFDDVSHKAKTLMLLHYKFIVLLIGITADPVTNDTILIMEYMKHGSLEDLLFKQDVKLSRASVIRLALDIALGVNYLHLHNPKVLHRDLKSANVLLYRNKTRAKIADFGTAKFLHTNVQAGTVIGNAFSAMPPEMLAEEIYDEKVDVFAFGVILYEMLTNKRLPILGENTRLKLICENIRNDQGFMKLVLDCCASDPTKRPHMRDIVELLRKMKNESK